MAGLFLCARGLWFVTRPRTQGVSAVCLTARSTLVLVRSTYEPGWNLPCGGLKPGEQPVDAVIRELREEIGLSSFDSIVPLATLEHRPNFKHDFETIFLVTGVEYSGPRNIEIECTGEFPALTLPGDSRHLERRIALCGGAIQEALQARASGPAG